jgi:radical SAM protein
MLVFYEVTRACDLVCTHCRACAEPAAHPAELSTQLSLRLIEQLAEFPDPPALVLTGGDPLKRADIYDLIRHAARRGLDVSITPSATPLVTRRAIRRLGRAGISRMAVSIDGPDAASHDRVRGVAGSFERSLEILADAADAGIPTQVNTTLTPDNVGRIDEMAEVFGRLGIVMWSVFFLVPVGRAAAAPRLSAAQCEQAFERLWGQSQRRAFAIKTTEAQHYRRYALQHRNGADDRRPDAAPARRHRTAGVNAGHGIMFVSHTGVIQPSGFLPIPCGFFPEQHPVQLYQSSPTFRALRDVNRLEGKCGVCEFRRVCGGSRARAYAVTGDFFAQEPDCSYVPGSYAPGAYAAGAYAPGSYVPKVSDSAESRRAR